MSSLQRIACLVTFTLLLIHQEVSAQTITGPLRVHPQNKRYFTDDSQRAILMVGSHTWNNLVDMSPVDASRPFDYDAYLQWLTERHHNFFRLWAWELLTWNTEANREKKPQLLRVSPQIWQRTGPGNAADNGLKFDLTQFDEAYFQRLRERVQAARERGIYASIMLFEGWGLQFSPDAWRNHPFHPDNNINRVNGDANGDGLGIEIHTLGDKAILEIQRAYVRKVIDTVNDLDNVLYEISNENHPPSTDWQYAMIEFIRTCEQAKPKQHPVGMTFQYKGGSNRVLFDSPADWISPNPDGGYRDNPPVADGSKIIINDTDHLWGIGGNPAWAWKSFLRGMHLLFMDPYDGSVLNNKADAKWAEPVRQSLGQILQWSRRVDLAAMIPRPDLASTGYCLANEGREYLVFLPDKTSDVQVTLAAGSYALVWFDTTTGHEQPATTIEHSGGARPLSAPFAQNALLYLRRS